MSKYRFLRDYFSILCLGAISAGAFAQNDAMMQAFYWDVPVNAAAKDGTWWNNLKAKAQELSEAGITGIWAPSPAKGNFGIYDMGYGIFDHYDLGNYFQKGTTETRFGSRTELEQMIDEMHTHNIEVYADIILNHMYTSFDEAEPNPAVKQYVFDKAFRNGTQFAPYPSHEILWTIPDAQPGDYYIKVSGYNLNWGEADEEIGYDLQIDWQGAGLPDDTFEDATPTWESEPNNGGGQYNVYPTPGETARGRISASSDIDEWRITLSSANDIVIRLWARRDKPAGEGPWEWEWVDPNKRGYYPVEIWHNGVNLAPAALEARTGTGVSYVTHTGTGEKNHSWNYTHFHPVDQNDWLGWLGSDEIITNTKFFGNDLNTFDPVVRQRLKDWGYWMADVIDFDGFRMDFVRGFQEEFLAEWVNNLPLLGGKQRFIVGEYWGADYRIKDWVNNVAAHGADVDGFDFPLKFTLTQMCNGNGSEFDMRWLNNAGMVRNTAHSLPGTSVVTFVDNHDTGKEHDKWVHKDWKMAYAYMLTHEGRPCIFYPHYYGVEQVDAHDASHTTQAPASLKDDINKLLFARKTYMDGGLTVLTQDGSPYPAGDAHDVYVARRGGNATKSGAIIAINNNDSNTKGVWVHTAPSGWGSLAGTTLVNAFNPAETTQVQADGRAYFSAPARGYAVYVKQSEYVAYTAPSGSRLGFLEGNDEYPGLEVSQNYPNPSSSSTHVQLTLPEKGRLHMAVYDLSGKLQKEVVKGKMLGQGKHEVEVNHRDLAPGIYIYKVNFNGREISRKMNVN